jgi:hypothetical protein
MGRFLEDSSGRVVDINRAKREIVVEIIEAGPGNERDRRIYDAGMLARDFKVFEGRKMFADHLTPDEEKKLGGRPRSINGLTGRTLEAWWDSKGGVNGRGAVRARVGVSAPWLWELISHDPQLVELSINAFGKTRPTTGKDGRPASLVESITRCDSVDWVAAGGAGGRIVSFLESRQGNDDVDLESLTMEDLIEARPDLIVEIQDEFARQIMEDDAGDDGEADPDPKDSDGDEDGGDDADGDDDEDGEGEDDDGDDAGDDDDASGVQEGKTYTASEVETLLRETAMRTAGEIGKRQELRDTTRALVEAANLPPLSAQAIIEAFHDFGRSPRELKAAVGEAIKLKRQELSQARGGRIRGNGMTASLVENDRSSVRSERSSTSEHDRLMAALDINDDSEG